jgi:hypothetical protein
VGACMRKPRSAIIFLVFLIFGLALAVPPEDMQGTAYDESESPPYEGTTSISTDIPATADHAGQEPLTSSELGLGVRPLSNTARVLTPEANRYADARVSSALLCTLRC